MHRREPCLRATCGTDADCDDADVCNGLERCESGTCVLGTPLGCMPGNVVIVAPQQATPNPTHVTLSMVAELNAIDVYSLLDRSASMSTRRARRSSSPPRTPVRVMCLLLETSAVWYFAYGSNIQSAILRNRRGVSVLRAPRTGRRLAPHARQAPPLLGTGTLANIVRDPAAGVFGVIFEIRAEDLDRRGHCEIRGRVGALIEVAAGFHPDLTGRENIYLQGAIMGMKRAEIARKFEEIVEFSGVRDFIDTQVKRYSSGMNARLGFAIAAHLDPDVLLIDEVLAVGDFAFQQKAFDRIKDIVHRDIPVIVVSHHLERIASLCDQAILLDRGAIACQGTPTECIASYVMNEHVSPVDGNTSPIQLTSISVAPADVVPSGERVRLAVTGSVLQASATRPDNVVIRIRASQTGQVVFMTNNSSCEVQLPVTGDFRLEADLQMNVPEGVYFVETSVRDANLGRSVAGPYACIQVQEGPYFRGTVQMNAIMRVVTLETAQRSAS